MPSSISGSSLDDAVLPLEPGLPPIGSQAEIHAARVATTGLIGAMVFVLLSAEFGARYLYPRISHIQHRVMSDQLAVKSLGADANPPSPSVLLVGNSLLLRGLDYPRVRQSLSPNIRPVRYVIENTEYLDWYYGLKRLFAEGVRPSKVVVCLNLAQTLSHSILSESPRELFLAGDLLAASRDAGLDTTQTSNVVFSHWSAFYTGREGIRNFILNSTAPAYARELHRLANVPPILPSDEEMIRLSRERLRALNDLCREHGTQLMFVIPPSIKSTGRSNLLLTAGSLEGIDVDEPVPSGSLGAEYFRGDRYHLNEKGAIIFTDALARDLRSRLH